MSSTRSLRVRAGGATRDYAVHFGEGLACRLGERLGSALGEGRAAVVSDSNVAPLHAPALRQGLGLPSDLYTFPAGEGSKTVEQWRLLGERMLADGHDRSSTVIALGGGVTGDLAGFVAATFMRGVPFVQVPTSTLAMVDASVGGKTGVNAPQGKNLVGAFHPPRAVVIDPLLLGTLPPVRRAEGWAEAVKHGAIRSRSHFESIEARAESLSALRSGSVLDVLEASVGIKASVVEADELEGGVRRILNFGHTLAHGLERASGYTVPHGQAVAIGMVAEARLGEALGVTESGSAERIAAVLRSLGLETETDLDRSEWVAAAAHDKKGRQGRPRYVLLRAVGEVDPGEGWMHEVPNDTVVAALGRG